MSREEDSPLPGDILAQYRAEIAAKLDDAVHVRLIRAYSGTDPHTALEVEFRKILVEVLNDEN